VSEKNPYTAATPLDQILTALQIWRNMDHADNIRLSRNDVVTIIEGVRALRSGLPTSSRGADVEEKPEPK
jgi:hypothetical protein